MQASSFENYIAEKPFTDRFVQQSPSQLIICAMDRSEIQEYKDQANTIFLTENKLLDTKKYKELKTLFTFETFST
ncbi:hypothetical protein I8P62_07825 [Acinetobacter baumannii]|nr:hypothetical protein [Acinetobacter baumannii]